LRKELKKIEQKAEPSAGHANSASAAGNLVALVV